MDETKLQALGGNLRAYYWRLRACRGKARSTWYRKILIEKKRLLDAGVSCEALRLYCLWLVNPKLEHRQCRFENHCAQGTLDLRFDP
jgi:hypothetical protein